MIYPRRNPYQERCKMSKGMKENKKEELRDYAHRLSGTFFNQRNHYAIQTQDGRYLCQHYQFHEGLMESHLIGYYTLASYLLDDDGMVMCALLAASTRHDAARYDAGWCAS